MIQKDGLNFLRLLLFNCIHHFESSCKKPQKKTLRKGGKNKSSGTRAKIQNLFRISEKEKSINNNNNRCQYRSQYTVHEADLRLTSGYHSGIMNQQYYLPLFLL